MDNSHTRNPVTYRSREKRVHILMQSVVIRLSRTRTVLLASARGLSLKGENVQGISRRKKVAMWEKEFICLANVSQKRTPAPLHKAELIRASLGVAPLSFIENGNAWEFHEEVLKTFPKLHDGAMSCYIRRVGSCHEL